MIKEGGDLHRGRRGDHAVELLEVLTTLQNKQTTSEGTKRRGRRGGGEREEGREGGKEGGWEGGGGRGRKGK